MFSLNYLRSNRIKHIDFDVSPRAEKLSTMILDSSSTSHRQALSLQLCDELCDLAKVDVCNVKISEAKQYHRKSKGVVSLRQYGFYKPATKYIYINNRTAVRGQILAAKTFLNTLLHEWLHHYDSCKLGLDSIHTKGFYLRLQSLEQKLRPNP